MTQPDLARALRAAPPGSAWRLTLTSGPVWAPPGPHAVEGVLLGVTDTGDPLPATIKGQVGVERVVFDPARSCVLLTPRLADVVSAEPLPAA